MKNSTGATVVTAFTAPVSVLFIRGQSKFLRDAGFKPVIVSSPGAEVAEVAKSEGAEYKPVTMFREPRPLADLGSLWRLVRLFRQLKPDIVNAGTPKAGLLCSLAAFIAGVPVSVYTLHGFRHESMRGIGRRLMIWSEGLVCRVVDEVVCVSPSVLEMGRELSIIPARKGTVLGQGSCGVNLDPFLEQREREADSARASFRARLGIPAAAQVIGFVGRLIPRKGIVELVQAWQMLREDHPDLYLLLVGPTEDSQPLPTSVHQLIEADERIVATGYTQDVPRHMAAMDVFTLPAHWEGFGNVLVEAAALGIPVVTTSGTGTRDAVADGENGTLVRVKDVPSLHAALDEYIRNEELRNRHGARGPQWASKFSRVGVWSELVSLYRRLLSPSPS